MSNELYIGNYLYYWPSKFENTNYKILIFLKNILTIIYENKNFVLKCSIISYLFVSKPL